MIVRISFFVVGGGGGGVVVVVGGCISRVVVRTYIFVISTLQHVVPVTCYCCIISCHSYI